MMGRYKNGHGIGHARLVLAFMLLGLLALSATSLTMSEGIDANLTVWDDSDLSFVLANQTVRFYANYSNVSMPINGSNVTCKIRFNISGPWQDEMNMTFNGTSNLYDYNRTFVAPGQFTFNVVCNASHIGHDVLSATDNMTVSPDRTSPLISNLSDIVSNETCLISFDTDMPANATIIYGNSSALLLLASNSSMAEIHAFNLTGLVPSMLYYYNVTVCNIFGNCTGYGIFNFTTDPNMDIYQNRSLLIHVNNSLGADLENVSISVADRFGEMHYGQTNSTGYLMMSLIEYVHNATGIFLYSNYTFTLSKSGYVRYDKTINLSSDKAVNVTLVSQTGILPNITSFTGDTTDLGYEHDLTNVTNFTLATDDGRIRFNSGVNVSGLDLDSNIDITSEVISLNTILLGNLNTTATLTFENISCPVDIIYYSSVHTTNISELYQSGSDCEAAGVCTNKQCLGDVLSFDVLHFSSFAAGLNSNLTIWDDTDFIGVNVSDQMMFYANYSNSTSPLYWPGIYCEIMFNLSGSWQDNALMDFNSTYGLYVYSRSFASGGSFDFRVICNASAYGFGSLGLTDGFSIDSSPAPQLEGYVCPVGCEYTDLASALMGINNTEGHLVINGSGHYEAPGGFFRIEDIDGDGVILITARDALIDCNGSTLSGYGAGSAIKILHSDNITLRDCIVADYSIGIVLSNSSNITLENLTAESNDFYGVNIFDVYQSVFSDLVMIGNGAGEYPRGGGILIRESGQNIFNRTYSLDNRGFGIKLRDTSGNILDNVSVITNHPQSRGSIYLSGTSDELIQNSYTMSPKTSAGIYFNSSDANTVRRTEIFNQSYAFFMLSSDSNVIIDNYVHGNVQAIRRISSSSNIFANNSYDVIADFPRLGIRHSELDVDFRFNISNAINGSQTTCALYLNGSWQSSIIGISDSTQTISETLDSGYYIWSVECTDPDNNSAASLPRTLALGDVPSCFVPMHGAVYNGGVTFCNNESPYNTTVILNASDMIVDCNGSVFAGGSTSFEIGGNNITLLDCVISDYDTGVYIDADYASIINLTISNCTDALYIIGDNSSISMSSIKDNERSVYLEGLDSDISGNYFCHNANPISTIAGNSIYQNAYCIDSTTPARNGLLLANPVEFGFMVTDMINLSICDLVIEGSVSDSQSFGNGNNSFILPMINGSYSWFVNCSDPYDNYGSSALRSFDFGYQDHEIGITPIYRNETVNMTLRLYRATTLEYEFDLTDSPILENVTYGLYDMEFSAYDRGILVTFSGFNFTGYAQYYFGLDLPLVSGYIVAYSVTTNITGPATVTINYTGNSVNENYLDIYRCADWNFTSQSCGLSWAVLSSVQSRALNLMSVDVDSFSAFGLYQGVAPPSSGSSSSGSWFGNVDFECSFTYQCPEGHVCINRACIENPTCDDGILNQGETAVDCGGPCDPCAFELLQGTCADGILNQGEEGIDCGGPCDACEEKLKPMCYDGIQNQGELGVDCGGPCDSCAKLGVAPSTCFDGVKNGLETAVDCGGLCKACSLIEQPVGVLIDNEAKTSNRLFVLVIIGVIIGIVGFGFFFSREKILASYNEYVSHMKTKDEETEKLKSYINHVIKTGQPPEKIAKVLVGVGWPQDLVIRLINREIDRPQQEFFEFAEDDDDEIDFFT